MAMLARDESMRGILVPRENANEAAVVDGLEKALGEKASGGSVPGGSVRTPAEGAC